MNLHPDANVWEPSNPLLQFLARFVTAEKRAKMGRVILNRTRHLQVVLEDIFQPHNASAVMRSCECFGVQHLNVIENRYPYTINRDVAMGSQKWISLHRYNQTEADNTRECLHNLKSRGYRIVATALSEDAVPLPELPVDRPLALCFGTEEEGLSDAFLQEADECVQIPMFGFTQSFNISVSAAICLHDLCSRIHKTVPNWPLAEDEREYVYRQWLHKILPEPDALERRFFQENPSRTEYR